jgi:hypothetical protein
MRPPAEAAFNAIIAVVRSRRSAGNAPAAAVGAARADKAWAATTAAGSSVTRRLFDDRRHVLQLREELAAPGAWVCALAVIVPSTSIAAVKVIVSLLMTFSFAE